MRWARQVARVGKRSVYRVLVGKSEGKKPLGRSRRRWEDNILTSLALYMNEMGGAGSTCWEEKCIQGFGGEI